MIERYQLPTASDIGLADIQLARDPALFDVQATIIGESEDTLRARAENGEWGLYETHEIDADSLSLLAVRARFRDVYPDHSTDARIIEPGEFIDAVWKAQRVLPDVVEFASYLATKKVLKPEEAAVAHEVDDYTDLENPDSDDAYLRRSTGHILRFIANVSPEKPFDGAHLRDMATAYAGYASRQYEKPAAAINAHELLLQARGLAPVEIHTALDAIRNKRNIREVMNPYRIAGLSLEQAEQLMSVRRPNVFGNDPWKSAQQLAEQTLHGDVAAQVAARQFFGGQNLVDMLSAQVEMERAIKDRRLGFSSHLIGLAMAGTRMVSFDAEHSEPHRSYFLAPDTSENLEMAPETLATLGSLAAFAIHEPPLRGLLSYTTANMIMADYRLAIDQQQAAA